MEQLSKPEVIVAGGAIIISAGSFIYLNSKLEGVENSVKQFSERFITMIAKLDEHDGNIKILRGRVPELESVQKSLINIQNNLNDLNASISEDIQSLEKIFKTQDRRIKILEAQLEAVTQNLGISNESIPVNLPEQILKKPKKMRNGLVKKVQAPPADDLESSVTNVMNMLLNIS